MPTDDLFDFGYLEPRGTMRHTLDNVHVRCAQPVVLLLEYGGPGTPARAAYDSANIKGATQEQVLKAVAPHVVKGWENVNDKSGAPAPCTPDAVKAMIDGLLKNKRIDIMWSSMLRALNPDNFRDAPSSESLGKE